MELDNDAHFFSCCVDPEEAEWALACERGDRSDPGGAELRWERLAMLTLSSALRLCLLDGPIRLGAVARNGPLDGSKLFCVWEAERQMCVCVCVNALVHHVALLYDRQTLTSP